MVKKARIGHSWTTKIRKVHGRNRKVKVRRIGKRYQVRVMGFRNPSDGVRMVSGKTRRR